MKKLWPVPDCRIKQIIPDGPAHLRIAARGFQRARRCPDCGRASRAVHSRYERHLADLPSLGRSVSVHLWVRRFYCRNTDCARQTFVERLPKLVAPFARRTDDWPRRKRKRVWHWAAKPAHACSPVCPCQRVPIPSCG
jgi:transposase